MSQVQSFTENRHEIDDLMLFVNGGAIMSHEGGSTA